MMENDLISRKKLIDDLEAWRKILDRRVSRFDDMVIHTLPVVFDLVNEQKAVKAEPKWISVKERLPENEGWVLIIGLLLKKRRKGSYGWCVPHVAEYRHGRWCDSDGMLPDLEERSLKVTHWMPLPEPPKEE